MDRLIIENFKSIKRIEMECKRVNVLIGGPNTGKSNILEALGLVCALQTYKSINMFVRYRDISDIFYFKEERPIRVTIDGMKLEFYSESEYYADEGLIQRFTVDIPVGSHNAASNPAYSSVGDWEKMLSDACFKPAVLNVPAGSTVTFVNRDSEVHAIAFASNPLNTATWRLKDPALDSGPIQPNGRWSVRLNEVGEHPYVCYIHPWQIGKIIISKDISNRTPNLRFYRFDIDALRYASMVPAGDYLDTPSGSNLNHIIRNNRGVRERIKDILEYYGLRLLLTQHDILVVLKEKRIGDPTIIEDIIMVDIPYHMLSDGLQRIIFYTAAILSNKDAVIALEEPEAHVFPAFTKQIAEMIAHATNKNQFFISTHNPYFLLTLAEKCSKDDINILVTYMDESRSTCVRTLTYEKIQQLLEYDYDVFFNIDRLLE
ncbi:MAG: AAA family ATPase [Candidatus Nitrosocaldus sp.]|nr:AAA family ATPase [Candidatus Nitrosocaldus sp.]